MTNPLQTLDDYLTTAPPHVREAWEAVRAQQGGETMRDRMAMAALTSMCGDSNSSGNLYDYASDAYRYADAMLAARARHG